MSDNWWRTERGDLLVNVRVQPNARRDEITGVRDGRLQVRLVAPPDRGRANEALRRHLADAFGVRLSAVRVKLGATSRNKVVVMVGLTEPTISPPAG